ncbi:MAG: PTS sugar transporter subunit IIA [Gemmatimonadetes bacterium]|nr:PTS sugar transporter subunit IIA [Gemmatimonadota bacterium]
MRLRDFLEPQSVNLDLRASTRDAAIAEMIALLGIDERAQAVVAKLIDRREQVGSTAIGRGVAIPHCRTLAVSRLRMAFGRSTAGIDFGAPDQRPVHAIFLIVAPPNEVSNQYLPVLARIAQLAKEPDRPERLATIGGVDEFFALLDQAGV